MKTLFNKYEAYNNKGGEFQDELQKVIDPIMEKWVRKGYSTLNMENIAMSVVSMSLCVERMKRGLKLHKAEMKRAEEIA